MPLLSTLVHSATLALGASALGANALIVPPNLAAIPLEAAAAARSNGRASSPASASRDPLPPSSARRSLNFGLTSGSHSSSGHSFQGADFDELHGLESARVDSFNDEVVPELERAISHQCPAHDAQCIGQLIATQFAHSRAGRHYVQTDGFVSAHSGVYHAHFVEKGPQAIIADSLLNVNVDTRTHKLISFGDSSTTSPRQPAAQHTDDGQIVFGQQHESPPIWLAQRQVGDARDALISFLALASDSPSLVSTLRNPAAMRQLRDRLTVTPVASIQSGHGEQVVISGFPAELTSNSGPLGIAQEVKAQTVHLQSGTDELALAWRFEVITNDNMYEAYVDATPAEGAEVAQHPTLAVVDWVRDFRPTGGELSLSDAIPLDEREDFEHLLKAEALSKRDVLPEKFPFRIGTTIKLSSGESKMVRMAKNSGHGFATSDDDKTAAPVERVQWDGLGTKSAAESEYVKKLPKVKPTYRVFPWGLNAPDEGKRVTLHGKYVDLDKEASPVGWHAVPAGNHKGYVFYNSTRGNNIIAQENWQGGYLFEDNYRPVSSSNDMSFVYDLGWGNKTVVDPKSYINASVTELFYTGNEIHDLFYRYGFDEVSGNFQEDNFDRGGLGRDAVQTNAQDGSGTNNANFATPPDGQRPRMRMYVWTNSQPYRDGDLEAGIVIHEYAHGISTRLTGGPANSGCLGWGEAGGAGEGWGDWFATIIRMHASNETDFSMGEWASNRDGGIRNYRYSRNQTINQDTYKSLDKGGYWGVHAIGEVWAEMLFEVVENFIDKHGWSHSLFPPAVNATKSAQDEFYHTHKETGLVIPRHGNTLFLQLVLDGMKLQPCRPSFQQMRDAILQADKVLTGGENACLIWKGFSKRGLGPKSKAEFTTPWGGGVRTEDMDLPKSCKPKKH